MGVEDLGTLRGVIKLDDQTGAGAASATRTFNNLKSTVASVALGMVGAGGLVAAITTVMYGIKSLAEQAIEFEDSMARVQARTGMTSEELSKQSAEVLKLAVTYGRDAGGLAKALDLVYEGGVKSSEAIDFLNVAVKGAKIGNMEYGQSISMLDGIIDNFNLTAKDAPKVLDLITKGAKVGEVSMGALGEALKQVAPIASETGLSLNELIAAISTMTKKGVPLEQAVMGLKGALNEMLTPSKALAKAIGGDNIIAAGGFQKALENLMKYTGGNIEEIGKLIPSIRMLPGILKLASNGGADFAESQKQVAQAAGEADRQTKILIETKKTLWARAWEAVKHPSVEYHSNEAEITALEKKNKTVQDYNLLIDIQKQRQETLIQQSEQGWYSPAAVEKQIGFSNQYIAQWEKEKKILLDKTKSEADALSRSAELKLHPLTPGATPAKSQSQIDREKEESDKKEKIRAAARKQADQEEMQRKVKLADLEMQTDTAIHEVRVRSYQEQIELWEKEADRADKTETEKLGYSLKALEKRKELAQIEYAFAIDHLKDLRDKEIVEAKGKKDVIDQIEKWYIAASKNIDSEFATRTEKVQKLITEVEIKLDDSAMTKLSKEVSFNFKKWADDLKNGSVAAWRGLIGDTTETINTIGKIFGGLPDKVSGAINDIGGIFDAVLSGNPVKVFSAVANLGKRIADYFSGDTAAEKQKEEANRVANQEAREGLKIAAANAKEAAIYFLKMQGKADLSLMSMSELRGMEGETQGAITALVGAAPTQMVAGKRWTQADTDAVMAVPGASDLTVTGRDIAMAEVARKLSERMPRLSQEAIKMQPQYIMMMAYLSNRVTQAATLAPLEARLSEIRSQESFRTQVGMGYAPDESTATTWENAKAIIDQKHTEGTYSDALYASKLQEYAHKFWENVSPSEMMSINAMGSGGVAAPVAGPAQVAENASAEILSSLWRDQPRSFLGALSGASAAAGSVPSGRDIRVAISIDPNIPINSDSATQMGLAVADQIAVQVRAGGI